MSTTTKNKFTVTHRVIHWLIALLLLLLFITGFLRMEWMSKQSITTVINDQLPGVVSTQQARSIAKGILAPMWEWHVIAAYCITVVFIVRIVYMVSNIYNSSLRRHFLR